MKTISARIPTDDAELFQLICEEFHVTQSEAIRTIIQAFINKTFDVETSQQKTPLSFTELKTTHFQHDSDAFYKSFRLLNRSHSKEPMLRAGSM